MQKKEQNLEHITKLSVVFKSYLAMLLCGLFLSALIAGCGIKTKPVSEVVGVRPPIPFYHQTLNNNKLSEQKVPQLTPVNEDAFLSKQRRDRLVHTVSKNVDKK